MNWAIAWFHAARAIKGRSSSMPDKYKPPYQFSTHIGGACAKQFRTFVDLAEKLKMPVEDVMRQWNGKVSPSKEDSSVRTVACDSYRGRLVLIAYAPSGLHKEVTHESSLFFANRLLCLLVAKGAERTRSSSPAMWSTSRCPTSQLAETTAHSHYRNGGDHDKFSV